MITTCLLIEDDADDQYFFVSALQEVDPSVICLMEYSAGTALDKLQQYVNEVPDIIFLDLNLAGMTGKQCLSKLKQMDRLNQVPVVIYSTSNYPGDVSDTKELGASGYVVKPEGYFALKHTLREVLFNYTQKPDYFFCDRSF